MKGNHLVIFDAAGTLFDTAEPVEAVYSRCFLKYGFEIPERIWKSAFRSAFSDTPAPDYTGYTDGNSVERQWWMDVVFHAAAAVGVTCRADTKAKIFEELFSHYEKGDAWRLFGDTIPALDFYRESGARLAIASNFDSRLHRVIDDLGVSGYFEFVLTSGDVLARKPSPVIIEKLLEISGVDRAQCCLIGDSTGADGGAAAAAGIQFYLIDRPSKTLADVEMHFS
ncbi:HAD-IA family hydrolase [Luteolibacter sp. AS25]|uniref:HAD-IA family hydrolase n=1 Tax=Luteolibacter sp. AS25 TaxID=3135776 RepID=UPI00398B012B